MKTTKFLTVMMAIVIAVSLNSCTKGDTGATGPQGPQGPAGTNGTNGTSGLTVTTVTVTPGDWSASSSTLWYYNASFGVNTTDACIVYFSENNSQFFGLPFSSLFYNGDELFYNYTTGDDVQIDYYNTGGEAPSTTLYFNVIDVPPAIYVKYPNTNWNNANEVAQLPEVQAVLHK